MIIRLLNPEDWQAWKCIRLEALVNDPASFGASFEEESEKSDYYFQETLAKNDIFGAWSADALIGTMVFSKFHQLKSQHRAMIWGVYIKPEHRGKGIAKSLLQTLIAHAKSRVMQLQLNCVTTNYNALNLYQEHDFTICGTEPRSLKIGESFFDEYLMVLLFN